MKKFVVATLGALCMLQGSPAAADAAQSAGLDLLNRLISEDILGYREPPIRLHAVPGPEAPGAAPQLAAPGALDLARELEEAHRRNAQLEERLRLAQTQAATLAGPDAHPNPVAPPELEQIQSQLAELTANDQAHRQRAAALSNELDRALAENASLKKRVADAQGAPANPAAPTAASYVVGKAPSRDVRASYAVGAWYGDSAPQETQKFKSIGLAFDVRAFAQGFTDKLHQRMQLPPETVTAELAQIDKQLNAAMLSDNQKHSLALLEKAAKEKGAIKTSEGAVYVILEKGKGPAVTGQSEIVFELDEKLATGEVLASGEQAGGPVHELPPLFQTVVKKLSVGGSARIHVPAEQAYGDAGIPGVVPPGALLIMTIRVLDVK